MSQGSFALEIAKFAEDAKGAIDDVMREIIIEIGGSVIRMSPVDTGRFRGNWQFSIGAASTGELDRLDKNGSAATAEMVNGAIQFKAGETAYIVNNLPYAIPLEYGHSDQAPGGMVRITLERFQRIVLEAVRNHQV
ncbi:HK97 gp10 family phage protein [Pseudomonas oryzihabitans]|uniref:HK97 gp10 family phage protein n=1 Tax=Pseudomonas oryzihabitans TaxID=47885 RepID=A0ABX3IV80_9PSED|nr:HK97 gp10 family phage protein [Pseudomonas psychrotolerans]ONN71729.1 hypothetical protein BVL52_08790 [Pseudomonas psychrotolerans]